MPYTVSKNDKGEFCVYKMDDNGDPMGDALGCHPSADKAGAQIGAIEANEKALEVKKAMRFSQDEVNYVTLSTTRGKGCANCRFFSVWDEDGDEKGSGYCILIENYPKDILPTGYCDRYEVAPDYTPKPVPMEVVSGMREATPEPEVQPEPEKALYAAPDSNKTGFFKKIAEKFKGGLKPGSSVVRAKDGKRYMFIVTSNSYEDREKETMTTDALKHWVDSCWIADDVFHTNNKHLIWHNDDLAIGDIVWADMAGPFLIEVAREGEGVIAKAAYDYFENSGEELGASHRFQYRQTDRDGTGTYKAITKLETSTLPREHAANLLTFSGVIPMSKSRDEYLNKMLGLPNAAELLKDGPQKLAEALTAKGVQHKSTEEGGDPVPADAPAEATETAAQSFAELLLQLIEAQADTMKAFDDLKAEVSADAETRQKDKALFDEKYAALEAENKALRDEMKLSPRVALTGKEKEAAEKDIEERNKKTNPDDLLSRMQAAIEQGG